jgi:uncharacterized protein YecT (DUF1311 family)
MMDFRAAICALLLAMPVAPALAQSSSCPTGTSPGDCERMLLEQADGELSRLIESKLADIGRRSTFTDRVERAQSLLTAAQSRWLQFRQAECEAQTATQHLISARTVQSLTAACLLSLTRRRIEEIRRY